MNIIIATNRFVGLSLGSLIVATAISEVSAQDNNQNYVLERSMLSEDGENRSMQVCYYDDWGNLQQTVTDACDGSGRFLSSYMHRDETNQIIRQYLPVSASLNQTTLSFQQIQTYGMELYGDSCFYTQDIFDGMGRETRKNLPGTNYQDHFIGKEYHISKRQDGVKRWRAPIGGGLELDGYYPTGSLEIEQITDPDGNIQQTFKDNGGRVVLVRKHQEPYNDTYYVYNDLGQLRFVLPPMCESQSDLDLYGYIYSYDAKGRIKSKKLPGCDPIGYGYNAKNQQVWLQDGELQSKGLYRFFLYDELGRLAIQGICNACPQFRYDGIVRYGQSADENTSILGTGYSFCHQDETITFLEDGLIETVSYYDDSTYNFLHHYAHVYHDGIDSLDLSQSINCPQRTYLVGRWCSTTDGTGVLTSYSYDIHGRMCRQTELGLNRRIIDRKIKNNFWGDVTNETVRYLSRNNGIGYHCDYEVSLENKYEIPHTKLLTSSLLVMKRKQNGVMKIDTTVIQQPTYDEFGHVVANDRSGTAADMQYAYDNLHGWLTQIQSSGGFGQTLYRETGGTQPRFNGNISAMTWEICDSDEEHRYDYLYDDLNRLTSAIYSETYRLCQTEPRPIIWGDDGIENPIDIIPWPDIPVFRNKYGETMTYDENSNITSLQRYGMRNDRSYGLIDDLSVSYYGNQRRSIDDAVTEALTYAGASDFVDKQNRGTEYVYNANGALTKDLNRGISNIEYDLLGNPKKITMTGDRSIEYIYSADGQRLRTIHSKPKLKDSPIIGGGPLLGMNNSISKSGIFADSNALRPISVAMDKDSTDYCGSLILRNAHPSQYLFEGGYASFEADTLSGWHYYVQDYMGNNRMVVNKDGTVEQITHYYPYGGVIGDISTNESLQAYKFEGKELDRSFGLDWYDIQARQYDAIGGTWYAIDKLAEKTPEISPYVMCAGNPVNFGDYDGMDWYLNDSTGNYTWFAEKKYREGYTYVGEKGAMLGELEAKVDILLSKLWNNEKKLYENNTTVYVDDSEDWHISDMFVWLSQFQYGNGPEITILTNPNHPYVKQLAEDKAVKEKQQTENLQSDILPNTSTQWEPWHHFTEGIHRPIMNFVGTFDFIVYPCGLTIAGDRKSVWSYFYHIPGSKMLNHKRSSNHFYGNTYQIYVLKK